MIDLMQTNMGYSKYAACMTCLSCHGMLTQKDPFAVLFSESKKHNPHDQKQETKIAKQEQNAILTQLKTK